MTDPTPDPIAAFLTARLDDEQRAAELAESLNASPWSHRDGVVVGSTYNRETDYDLWDVEGTTSGQLHMHDATAAHIARHDPARVLADVAAKRAVLRDYVHAARYGADWEDSLADVVRFLVQPYSDHPDFDSSWLP